MNKFLSSKIGQFLKGALLAVLAAVYPLLGQPNLTLKLILVAAAGGILEYLDDFRKKI